MANNWNKVKITLDRITYGPKDEDLDSFKIEMWAHDLMVAGYRRTSNAYCTVARIDRDDWLEVMAQHMHCSVADFYNRDGSGVGNQWRDHYVRTFSKDTHTVHPLIIKAIGTWR